MEVHHTADLPAVDKPVGPATRGPPGFRHVIREIRRKEVPSIEIAIAVIQLGVEGVIHDCCAVLADLVQGMRPGVGKLRTQAVPRSEPEGGLKSVVVGCTDAVELKDVAKVREGTILVDVGHQIQLASLAADVPNLPNNRVAEALLYLQIVIIEVRRAEVLADGIGAKALGVRWRSTIRIGAERNPREDGVITCLNGIPLIRGLAEPVDAKGGDWRGTERVALNPLGCGDGRAEVQERVQVDLIEKDAESATNDEIGSSSGLIGEADSRRKVVSIRREKGIESRSLNGKSPSRDKVGYVLPIAVHRAEVFVPHAEIQVQLRSYLPAVLEKEIVRVHNDKAFRVPHGDRRRGHVASKKVC